jgi:hypothetical protein
VTSTRAELRQDPASRFAITLAILRSSNRISTVADPGQSDPSPPPGRRPPRRGRGRGDHSRVFPGQKGNAEPNAKRSHSLLHGSRPLVLPSTADSTLTDSERSALPHSRRTAGRAGTGRDTPEKSMTPAEPEILPPIPSCTAGPLILQNPQIIRDRGRLRWSRRRPGDGRRGL